MCCDCSGKTSLLFQFAFNCALSGNVRVVFICKRSRLESKPPYLSQGVDPCSDVFKRIEMKLGDVTCVVLLVFENCLWGVNVIC